MSKVLCSKATLTETLYMLRDGGKLGCETVVLWLGVKLDNDLQILKVFRPRQEVGNLVFRIPPESMRELMGYLRKNRMKIIAQVHSHPAEAFHSKADDEWAIVRHIGAISVVVPYFAKDVEEGTFADKVATFQLSADDKWVAVDFRSVVRIGS